jgi:serine/threonine-protein kinase
MSILAAGTVVDGRYRVLRPLDAGGMGAVFVVEHVFLRKEMALKVLRTELAVDPGAVARFEREARAASAIEHPNIVRVNDFGRSGELVYLVMELLQGQPLSAEMGDRVRMQPERAVAICAEILRALEAAHGAGIVHRDLKPENVFLVQSGGVKLVDFGIAQLKITGEARLTSSGAVMGTPLYMAPEQVRGQRDLDARVDLHAVGVMLYEMLAGQPPYQGEQFGPIAHAILTGTPPELRAVAPDVDPALAAIVMKAFAPDREKRFSSARELREALERWRPGALEAQAFAIPRESMLTGVGKSLDRETNDQRAVAATVNATVPAGLAAPDENLAPLELDRPAPAPPAPEPPRRSRAGLRIAAAATVLVLLGAGGWVATARLRASRVMAPSHYKVINLPPGAKLKLDGAPTDAREFDVDPSRTHTLVIEARGYVARPLQLDEHADPIIDGTLTRAR